MNIFQKIRSNQYELYLKIGSATVHIGTVYKRLYKTGDVVRTKLGRYDSSFAESLHTRLAIIIKPYRHKKNWWRFGKVDGYEAFLIENDCLSKRYISPNCIDNLEYRLYK